MDRLKSDKRVKRGPCGKGAVHRLKEKVDDRKDRRIRGYRRLNQFADGTPGLIDANVPKCDVDGRLDVLVGFRKDDVEIAQRREPDREALVISSGELIQLYAQAEYLRTIEIRTRSREHHVGQRIGFRKIAGQIFAFRE